MEIDGWSEIIKPNRSAMTRYHLAQQCYQLTCRKQWILKKYVEREWVLECLPQNPEILCSINLYEQRCFKQLKIMGWVPPVSKSSSPQRTPKGRGDNEINLERSPKNLTAAVVTPIKAGSYEDVLVISSQPREETTETRVRVAKNIFATKSSGQSLPEPISVAPPSRKQISDSKPGKPANLSLTPYTSFNPTVKPAPKIVKPNLAARPQSPTSEFSDDLYGTGRPLRPGLINPTSVIHEWLISSTGNPPLSVSATAPWEEHPDLPPPIIKPNRLHEWSLIPIEGEDLPVGSGETITEEDSSILAELNEAFIHQGDEEREAVRMEDDLTEVGSEVEKIVFEFEWSKGPIPKGAKEFEGEESDEDVGSFEIEDLEGGVDDCLSECTGNVSDAEVILETDVIWEVCAEGKASKKEFQEREKRFEEAPPTSHEIPRELSSKTESIPENTEPQEFQEEPQSLSSQVHEPSIDIETGSNTELKQSIPSSFVEEHISETQSTTRSDPFATVLSNLKLSKNKVCDIAESPYLEHAGKQDLRLFLLKSGLFSKQVF